MRDGRKKVVILGSTGSIGVNTLKVIAAFPRRFRVIGLAVNRNASLLLGQAERFGVRNVAVADAHAAEACSRAARRGVRVLKGQAGVETLAGMAEADVVVCAVDGVSALKPVMAAIRSGSDVALATKEVLVAAGPLVMRERARRGVNLLPVDSEHSAIFQCIEGRDRGSVKRIILTASGGPFGCGARVNLDKVTVREALAHPSWNMGRKVTVDSATLMNKGLEVIEAHWLFGLPLEKIGVLIHPESIIHSFAEFTDGAMIAHLSVPDMRFAIQYALTYPERPDGGLPALDLAGIGALRFMQPDTKRFPCLLLARKAAEAGGTMPAALNAANEIAVRRFLEGRLRFSRIPAVVERVMSAHKRVARPDIGDIIEADREARKIAREVFI